MCTRAVRAPCPNCTQRTTAHTPSSSSHTSHPLVSIAELHVKDIGFHTAMVEKYEDSVTTLASCS
jgi:hypothetical protein